MKKLMKITLALAAMVLVFSLHGCKNNAGGGSPEDDNTNGGIQNVVTPDDTDNDQKEETPDLDADDDQKEENPDLDEDDNAYDDDPEPDTPTQPSTSDGAYTAYSDFFDDGDKILGDVWEVSSKEATGQLAGMTINLSTVLAVEQFDKKKSTRSCEEFFDGLFDAMETEVKKIYGTIKINELSVNEDEGKITHTLSYYADHTSYNMTTVFSKK